MSLVLDGQLTEPGLEVNMALPLIYGRPDRFLLISQYDQEEVPFSELLEQALLVLAGGQGASRQAFSDCLRAMVQVQGYNGQHTERLWSDRRPVPEPDADGETVEFRGRTIGLNDFLFLTWYVLTNSDLLPANDPRPGFVAAVKQLNPDPQ